MTRRAVFAFALLAAVLPGRVLQSLRQPAFRSSTLGVRVDVRVTDGRKPVAGLAAADFELRDNGVPQALELIQVADLPLNVVFALDVTSADARRSAALEDLTDATGGDVVRVGSSRDMHLAFANILQEFRSRYVLAYQPAGVRAGGFHRLDVRVKRRGLTVRARPGYIGLEPVK